MARDEERSAGTGKLRAKAARVTGAGKKAALLRKAAGRRRRKPGTAWTTAKEERFFEALAASCNVTFSAAAAGVSGSSVYHRRKREAGFRGRWSEALSTGYAQLELMMLERALHGVSKTIKVDGESKIIKEYCDRTALALLKQHRDTVAEIDREIDQNEVGEASERIIERLRRMRLQIEQRVETKGKVDRIALIAEVLRQRRRA